MARMDSHLVRIPARCRSSLLPYDFVASYTVTPTHNWRLAISFFFRHPAILPTVLGVPPPTIASLGVPLQNMESLGVPPLLKDILGVPSHKLVLLGTPLYRPILGVPPTCRPTSLPTSRQHRCHPRLATTLSLSLWHPHRHPHNRTAPYFNSSHFT